MVKTAAHELDTFAVERGWSDQRLSDEIYDALHVRLSYRTIARFRAGSVRTTRITQSAIDRFMARCRTPPRQPRQAVSR